MLRITNHIAGKPAEPITGRWLDNVEPATGKVWSQVADSGPEDVERAVDAAADAFPGWSGTPAEERSRILLRLADLIDENLDRLAELECKDNGKPLSLAKRVDIPRAASNLRFFATAILHTNTEAHEMDDVALNVTLRKARGVAGLISPWNLPLYLFTWKIAPALATGNTCVAKPSELTPATATELASLAMEAGLPAGVLNVVHGTGASAGAAIVAHEKTTTISFTGGTETGTHIARIAAPMFKKLSLELGGKNPNIIFADADFDEAIPGAVRAGYTNQGQICLCGSRILVERSRFDEFVDGYVKAVSALRVGDPLDAATDVGALISAAHRNKVRGCVELARKEGGEVLIGGDAPSRISDRCAEGFFFEPTVIVGLGSSCRTQQEEIFGPVVTISPFDSEDDAITQANSTDYGLAAMIWTNDLKRAHRVAERVDAGVVWVNCWLLRDLRTPFGGMKRSGVGREGGAEALRFFTEPKNICFKK